MLKRALAGLLLAASATWADAQEHSTASPQPQADVERPAAAQGEATAGTGGAAAAGPTRAIGAAATTAADAAPLAAEPDPLTPAKVDEGPAKAPGALERPAQQAEAGAADPVVVATRARLAGLAEPADASERADVAALRAYYAETARQPLWTGPEGLSARGVAALAALGRAPTFGLEADAFALPPPPQPGALTETLAEAEVAIGRAALKYARHARGGRIDPPSLSKMIDMRPRLYEPRSLIEALAARADADSYLEGLNPRHAGFVALKDALAKVRAEGPAGSKPPGDEARRIIVNMERWRWLPDDLGAFHVWDNVPEQATRVVHDGRVVLKERIVVGKPTSPTPIFSAPMRFVIFHPSWGVPEGIKTNELAPMLRRAQAGSSGWFFSDNDGASRVLRRHELKVFHGGREVHPDRVNWASVDVRQFQFTQPPSAKNVLGVVKFRFPNKFDVYMHDTSERHLFQRSQRTFSHGCMRVENPLRLAETILAYDKGWGRERIQSLVAREGTTDVTLDKMVPVHIVYFTAVVDEGGRLQTFPDVYGTDARVASALAGRSIALASVKPESKPEADSERPASPRKEAKSKQPVKAPKSASSESGPRPSRFDPFSSLSAN